MQKIHDKKAKLNPYFESAARDRLSRDFEYLSGASHRCEESALALSSFVRSKTNPTRAIAQTDEMAKHFNNIIGFCREVI